MNFDTPAGSCFPRRVNRPGYRRIAPKQYEKSLRKPRSAHPLRAPTSSGAKAWQKNNAGAGWAACNWPNDMRARRDPDRVVICSMRMGALLQLSGMLSSIGHGTCAGVPPMMAFAVKCAATQISFRVGQQKSWCPNYSRSRGGSDVAGLRTGRAEKNGDDWIIMAKDLDFRRALFRLTAFCSPAPIPRGKTQSSHHVRFSWT